MHCSTRSRTKTRKKRNSWCRVRRNPIPNRKHARTGTEMNDMKRFLPSLILAVSVCTGCRTGTVRPERSEAPEIAVATAQPPPLSVAGQLDIGEAMTSESAILNPLNEVPPSNYDFQFDWGSFGTPAPTAPSNIQLTPESAILNPLNDVPLTPTQPTIDFGDWVRAEE